MSMTSSAAATATPVGSVISFVFDQREFSFTIASNGLFLMASVLYLVLSIYDFQWEVSIQDIPDDVIENADDAVWAEYGIEDDYIFTTPQSQVPVSQYMMIYFSAALCFVLVGFVEWFHNDMRCYGIFFILAGGFGLLAAMYVEKEEDLSDTFDLVSSCLFILEAIQLFWQRPHRRYRKWMQSADGCFFLGAVLDVITSVITKAVDFSLSIAKVSIFSSCLWLLCALIYSSVTTRLVRNGGFRIYMEPEYTTTSKQAEGQKEEVDDDPLPEQSDYPKETLAQ